MLNRLPIRLRLTLAFAGVMALVLVAGAIFIRVSLASDLDQSINQSLRARAVAVQAIVDDADETLTEGGATLTQVLDARGRIVDATPLVRTTPLLTPAQLAAAHRGPVMIDVPSVPGQDHRARLLAVPAGGDVAGRVVVVGTGLESRDDAVRDLTILLAIGGPIALLLASAAGYGVASAALRPVEEMRARAERITGADHGKRLPVSPADDEIRRLGQTLNELLERTDAALAHERAFVADASHELRTPLAILKTELELALRGEHSALELREAIASAGEETDRLVRLAEDLLVMARSDQGGLPVRPQPLAVGDVMERVRDRHATRVAAGGRELSIDDAGTGTIVVADRARLEQALSNLVDNALRHGSGDVRLYVRTAGDATELHVVDGGPGMDPAFAGHAFDRFTRADPARGRGGAGLGLSIVRAIARAHGGDAHAVNVPGGGLDAWISLPAEDAPDGASPDTPHRSGQVQSGISEPT